MMFLDSSFTPFLRKLLFIYSFRCVDIGGATLHNLHKEENYRRAENGPSVNDQIYITLKGDYGSVNQAANLKYWL